MQVHGLMRELNRFCNNAGRHDARKGIDMGYSFLFKRWSYTWNGLMDESELNSKCILVR